jgi:hypothetical protein
MIFNHPLCLVHPDVQDLAVKSISDWKNGYLPECEPCSRKTDCGGFFVSSDLRHAVVRPYLSATRFNPQRQPVRI